MIRKKKAGGVEELKSRYGLYFCIPWIVGVLLFFLFPLSQSMIYFFCDVKLKVGGISTSFTGLENFKQVLMVDSSFTSNLGRSISRFSYSFPVIMIVSLILGILLNQSFCGKVLFRAVYFLPVIIASGVVIGVISDVSSMDLTASGTDAVTRDNMISASAIVGWLGLPASVSTYMSTTLSRITGLVWNCGVQIILYISGMQSIPDLLYEVAKVEGATKWEEFWFITFPSLARVNVLVAVYTMVDIITAENDSVMYQAIAASQRQSFGEASVMLWVYFLIIGAAVGVLLLLFRQFCLKKWD